MGGVRNPLGEDGDRHLALGSGRDGGEQGGVVGPIRHVVLGQDGDAEDLLGVGEREADAGRGRPSALRGGDRHEVQPTHKASGGEGGGSRGGVVDVGGRHSGRGRG